MSENPPGWEPARLADIAEVRLGRQRSPSRAFGDHMRPYMRAANVTWDGVCLDDVKEMDFTPAEFETYQLKSGDIILAEASGSASEVGKPAIWRDQVPGACFQNTLIRVRTTGALVSFLFWHFFNDAVSGRFASASKGVGIHHLSAGVLSNWQTRIPPLGEQARIVEALDSYLSRLDAAVASLERVQAKLRLYRASVLKAAVEGRLVPTEAELARWEQRDYEPATVLLERILKERRRRWEEVELARLQKAGKAPKDDKWKAKYKEPIAPDTSRLPELPEGWCWASVDQVAAGEENSLCDGPFGSNLRTAHYTESGPRVVRLQNIGDGSFISADAHIDDAHFQTLRKHAVFPGDLVVASLGSELPRACMIPQNFGEAIVKADCLRFKVDSNLAEPRFILHALNSPVLRTRTEKIVHGVGRPRIGLTLFRSIEIPLAPFGEQARIADQVDDALSVAEQTDRSLRANLQRSSKFRQSVLKWAFEGKLVDQDPADEPAEKLLERIRAERAAAKPAARPDRKRRKPATE